MYIYIYIYTYIYICIHVYMYTELYYTCHRYVYVYATPRPALSVQSHGRASTAGPWLGPEWGTRGTPFPDKSIWINWVCYIYLYPIEIIKSPLNPKKIPTAVG